MSAHGGRAMTEGQKVTAAAARDPGAGASAGPIAAAHPAPAGPAQPGPAPAGPAPAGPAAEGPAAESQRPGHKPKHSQISPRGQDAQPAHAAPGQTAQPGQE